MRGRKRASLWIATTVVIAAAVVAVLAYPVFAATDPADGLNLSAPASRDTCTPCHPRYGASRNPSVIFDHAAHLLIRCTACHTAPPHEAGASPTPAMTTCFTCHGLEHGPTGTVASGQCIDCHPAGYTFRPVSHVAEWKDRPHADASAGGVNGCLLCHDAPKDCDACHIEAGIDVPPMPTIYLSTVPDVKAAPEVVIDPEAIVTISQCVYCHTDIDAFSVDGLIFGHGAHLTRAYRCQACHPVFPHGSAGTARPEMRKCTRCHGLEHNGAGTVATAECEKCHTPEFPLIPSDHTPPFLSGEHKKVATEDAAYCSQCHAPEPCVPCHNGGVELADGRVSEKVIPADHKKPEWSQEHGVLYLQQKGMCVVCHATDFCQQCHVTAMPHPATWLADHADKNRPPLVNDCRVCHADRESCQECHHGSVRSAALTLENCVKCHEEMATDPPTEIKVPGLAEHAVHFQVALPEKQGKPYYCDDCHIGFGTSGTHLTNPATGPHDMRICYECHGQLDYDNSLIAPYAGAELCLRCHTDLNI